MLRYDLDIAIFDTIRYIVPLLLLTTKCGKQLQNDIPMTMHRSKSKLEIEFQYGGSPFSETGSSFISAVD